MLKENLQTQRKAKGFTQEELAVRLNVVRQTVSKWEKGHSVPDADLLIQMADIFEVSVSELLGAEMESEKEIGDVAQQLSRINEQLATINRRARRIWKTTAIVAGAMVALYLVSILFNYVAIPSNEPFPEASGGFGVSGELAKQVYDIQLADDIKTALIRSPKITDALVVVNSGERSPFKTDTAKATAHVFLTIDDGDALTSMEAQTVAELVRGTVPSIEYEDIHISDQNMNIYEVGDTSQNP